MDDAEWMMQNHLTQRHDDVKRAKGERFNAENTEFCSIEQASFVQGRTIHKQK